MFLLFYLFLIQFKGKLQSCILFCLIFVFFSYQKMKNRCFFSLLYIQGVAVDWIFFDFQQCFLDSSDNFLFF